MIKLLLIISSYEIGGVSSVAKNLLDSLDRSKFRIVFLAEKIQEKHFPIPEDVTAIDLKINPRCSVFGKISNMVCHIRNLRVEVATQKPDIVFSLSYSTSCYLLFKPIKCLRQKIIIGEYSEGLFVRPIKRTFRNFMSRLIYKILIFFTYGRAQGVVVVSRSIGRHLEKLFNLDKNKIRVIPTAVNIAKIKRYCQEPVSDYTFKKDCLYISLLSRLSPEKGIDFLLQAFARLRKKLPSKLIIIGEGSSRPALEVAAESLNITQDVVFLGYKDNPFKYLKNTDMFILPSIYEGFPNVILEAYACEVPVVATRCVEGIEELIRDGRDGLLVNKADVDSLYNAMYNLASNKDLRERLKGAGLKKVRGFDAVLKVKEYEDLFLEIVKLNQAKEEKR
ncbi:glycosyltransferase [Candidatus Omnitrophota bacterium]